MATVTVSSKHQITLPAEIVRELGLHGGDKLAVELTDGRIVAVPEPASWAEYMRGSARGLYGRTTQEIDRYVAEERGSWYTTAFSADADLEAFVDYYVAQEDRPGGKTIRRLAESPWPGALTVDEIAQVGQAGAISRDMVEDIIRAELVPRRWVRRIERGPDELRYRLRSDLAAEVSKARAA